MKPYSISAIHEWPQNWQELTDLLERGTKPLELVRIFAEIQFHINNQNIPNASRQKDLTNALCQCHDRLIKENDSSMHVIIDNKNSMMILVLHPSRVIKFQL